MLRFISMVPLAVALAACSTEGFTPPAVNLNTPPPLERVQASTFPMSQTVWRVVVTGDGRVSKDVVERVALYRAAELTTKRGYDRFIVQSHAVSNQQRPITQTLQQTGETAGAATNIIVPGAGGLVSTGSGAIVGGLDRLFTSYGGEIVIHMYKKDDTAGADGLDALETLNTYVNELKRSN